MEANELRIGNYVNIGLRNLELRTYSNTLTASEILDLYANKDTSSFVYEPIPLTEDWLLKFGFIYRDNTECWHSYNIILDKSFVIMDIDIRVHVKHVHQLQNIYFALTGKELKICCEN